MIHPYANWLGLRECHFGGETKDGVLNGMAVIHYNHIDMEKQFQETGFKLAELDGWFESFVMVTIINQGKVNDRPALIVTGEGNRYSCGKMQGG